MSKRSDISLFAVKSARPTAPGVGVGRIIDLLPDGEPLIDFDGNPFGPVTAKRTASVPPRLMRRALEQGLDVLLTFIGGDPLRPIVFDIVMKPSTRRSKRPVVRQQATQSPASSPITAEVRIGRVLEVRDGMALVEFEGNTSGPIPARAASPLRNLIDPVVFTLTGDGQAIIIGQLQPAVTVVEPNDASDVVVRGRTIRLEAEKELVLVCGASKVHLDARGKLVTTADQIVSRARGANKVQGGAVMLN